MPKFYHQTKSERWAEIQREGVLWGRPGFWAGQSDSYRYTYLAPDLFYGHRPTLPQHFDVVLEVEYEPHGTVTTTGIDNWGFHPPHADQYCWQFSVFLPLPLTQVRVIDPTTLPPWEELVARSKAIRPPKLTGHEHVPGMTDSQLMVFLSAAVPLWQTELRKQPWDTIQARMETYAKALAGRGGKRRFGSRVHGKTARVFNAPAEALAGLSFLPGGVTFRGVHWEAQHE
jgi:hypothetical protein